MAKTAPDATETVRLLREHEHRGIVCPAGSSIEIRASQRPLLERTGYIDPLTPYPRTPAELEARPAE
jgi:hypothetical protein